VRLQWAFLRDLADVYAAAEAALLVAHTPGAGWEALREVFPQAAAFFPQAGAGLGERMAHAFQTAFDMGYGPCLLTGSDLPLLKREHLQSGFQALETADVVLGPTPDGGYYMVGMKKPHPAVFAGQSYGHASVYENTLAAAEAAGYRVAGAACCADVDRPEDLRALCVALRGTESHSARFLQDLVKAGIEL